MIQLREFQFLDDKNPKCFKYSKDPLEISDVGCCPATLVQMTDQLQTTDIYTKKNRNKNVKFYFQINQ